MSRRRFPKGLVVDAFLLVFWIVVFLIELLFIQEIIWIIAALVLVFIFSVLLGRDVRRRGKQ